MGRLRDVTALDLSLACTAYSNSLIEDGCEKGVAYDRTMDALKAAVRNDERHCFDTRDRLFENRLRTIIYRREHEE